MCMRCRQVVLCMSPARPAKGFEHGVYVCDAIAAEVEV